MSDLPDSNGSSAPEGDNKLVPFKGDALTLTEDEVKRLAELESKIEWSNADRGRALREIRDSYLYRQTLEEQKTTTSKLATLKRITVKQAEALAIEKGAQLICESEKVFRKGRRRTNTITNGWYKLSTLPDKKFSALTYVYSGAVLWLLR